VTFSFLSINPEKVIQKSYNAQGLDSSQAHAKRAASAAQRTEISIVASVRQQRISFLASLPTSAGAAYLWRGGSFLPCATKHFLILEISVTMK
jgi:hypothetical protein